MAISFVHLQRSSDTYVLHAYSLVSYEGYGKQLALYALTLTVMTDEFSCRKNITIKTFSSCAMIESDPFEP